MPFVKNSKNYNDFRMVSLCYIKPNALFKINYFPMNQYKTNRAFRGTCDLLAAMETAAGINESYYLATTGKFPTEDPAARFPNPGTCKKIFFLIFHLTL